jgi:hypothetical protein
MILVYDQLDTLQAPPPPPPQREKRVRFAPFAEVYRDIPWARKPADMGFSTSSDLVTFDSIETSPLESSLKDSVYTLRTEIKGDEALTVAGIVILIFCLFILFFVIWFVVRKVLLLEVDAEIGNNCARQALKFR